MPLACPRPGAADDLNLVLDWLGRRDIPDLKSYAGPAMDWVILLGSSVPATLDAAMLALQRGLSSRLLISGGIGHATPWLREALDNDPRYRGIAAEGKTEAAMLDEALRARGFQRPSNLLLETESTNCGDNATRSRAVLEASGQPMARLLLLQDPAMQRRSHASFEKVFQGRAVGLTSFAISRGPAVHGPAGLEWAEPGQALWPMRRAVSLALGEIPRLTDAPGGYGPRGRGFIVHVAIPGVILKAHARLARDFPALAEERI